MDGIVLSRDEFLVFLDAFHSVGVVGISQDELFPDNIDVLREQIYRGQRSLEERGLLRKDGDLHVLDGTLTDLMGVVTLPDVAIVTGRNVPEVGAQIFLHYLGNQLIVEQTFPVEGQHRLATIESLPVLLSRIAEILPLTTELDPTQAIVLPEETFIEAKELAENGQGEGALTIFAQRGFPTPVAQALVDTIQNPAFSGTVAILRCAENEVVDAFSVAVVQGERSAWIIQ